MMDKGIGLHIRLETTLCAVAEFAIRVGIPHFQCFFIEQSSGHYINPSSDEVKQFRKLRKHFAFLYVHSTFLVNMARVTDNRHDLLHYEVTLAQFLEFTHLVIHPGTTKGSAQRLDGVDAIARVLNHLCRMNNSLTFVLENTAYAGMTIGSDFHDFLLIRSKLDKPERIMFCIDTAHAHAYGYDLITDDGLKQFAILLQNTVGLPNIDLIHLNDTQVPRGSHRDKHEMVGSGIIGKESLKKFITHASLNQVRVIMEVPMLKEEQACYIVDQVNHWR